MRKGFCLKILTHPDYKGIVSQRYGYYRYLKMEEDYE